MAVSSPDAAKSETAQSMDASSSARVSDATSESSYAGGVYSPASDPPTLSPSRSKDLELQAQAFQRSEEYRQLFRLPLEEVLIQDFNCALQENFLLQGHMYVFAHHICFYSNLFGFETKKVLAFQEITSVRRAKAAGIFPTAIEITAGDKKLFFTSFLSRDEAFKLLHDGLLGHGKAVNEVTDLQDLRTESKRLENGDFPTETENSLGLLVEEASSERQKDIPIYEEVKLPLVSEDVASSSRVQDKVEENAETVADTGSSLPPRNLTWVEEDSDVPKVADSFIKVAESKFQITVEEFFKFFYSDAAASFLELFHKRCGDKDFSCGSWSAHDEFGHVRDVSFQHPIKIYFGAKCSGCQETQKYRVYRNSHLVIETTQSVSDVPYADYFVVEGRWDVERDGEHGCSLRIYTNVAFSKKTMWKGKIVQGTLDEARDAYAIWIELAHETLKQKNLEKEEVAGALAADSLLEEARAKAGVTLGGQEVGASQLTVPQTSPHSEGVNQQYNATPLPSFTRETTRKFLLFMRSQSQVPALLLVTFAIILILMQLSIVVLLSRPHQQVQLIPQADHSSTSSCSLGGRMPEMTSWLDRRIHNLKDEMGLMETMLDKMQKEYAFLKAQVRDLEHFRERYDTKS